MKFWVNVLIACLLFGFVSCENNRFEANINNQSFNAKVFRIDKELFQATQDGNLGEWLKLKEAELPSFFPIYTAEIMRVGYPEDSLAAFRLQQFSSDTLWQGLQLEIDAEYQDFNEVYQELGKAILRVQYFFPELNTPNIVCFNSGFNIAVYPHKEFIGLGLEWFLNPESRYVKMLPPNNFPLYKRQGMDKKYIAYDAVKGWLLNRMYNDYYFNKDLLHEMVFYGKVMLVLEQAFPQAKIEDLFKLEEERMRWAEDNMHGVWKHIVSKNQLFSTNAREINKYVMDGPFTNEFGSESAPRLGWIIGWQMLKDYADEHDNLTLKEIVEQKNEQDILKSFNPKSFNK